MAIRRTGIGGGHLPVALCLEGFAAGLAALYPTGADIDALEANVEAMRQELRAGRFDAAARLDYAFHRRLLEASGNLAMLQVITASQDIFLESQKLPFIRPERAMETWQEHRKILRQLARGNQAGAQRAMQEHIRNAAARTVWYLRPETRPPPFRAAPNSPLCRAILIA